MNQSIHPRVVNGKTKYDRVNTFKNKDKNNTKKTLNNMEEHLVVHPKDSATKDHYLKLQR